MLDSIAEIQQLNLPWIDSPFFDLLLAQYNLDEETKQQVKHFADYGYLIIDTEIPNFDRLAEQIINNLQSHYIDPGRILDAWKFNDDVKTIATVPKIISILKTL